MSRSGNGVEVRDTSSAWSAPTSGAQRKGAAGGVFALVAGGGWQPAEGADGSSFWETGREESKIKYRKYDRLLKPTHCPSCGQKSKHISRRRQDTSYCDSNLNYRVLCRSCQKDSNYYWAETWKEYWYSQGG